MYTKVILVFIAMLLGMSMGAQQITIYGKFADAFTEVPLPQVKVSLESFFKESYSNSEGVFRLEEMTIAPGDYILRIDKSGYLLKRIPVKLIAGEKDMELILLEPDASSELIHQNTISLSDAELLSEEAQLDNISGILQSSRDVFLNASAFDFSQTFFRPRGLGSEYGKVLINGLEMNKLVDGRPQWANWGGLNDAQRNQVFSNGIAANDFQFGGLGGTTNIIMRASKYQRGGRISYAGANRSYTGRIMGTFASGEQKNGWYYFISLGRRFAEEAYIHGTLYSANSLYISLEKEINENQSLSFSGIYTPNIRGKSAAITQEVLDLKGQTYNPYWGFQNEKLRNSRIRKIKEPILMLNHFWKMLPNMELNTNISYQFGEISNSRIDYGGTILNVANGQNNYIGGGANPDPSYYQKLPSYFLRFQDSQNFEAAYRAQNEIRENGQLDWNWMYLANSLNPQSATYALTEDVNQDDLFTINSHWSLDFRDQFKLNSTIRYQTLKSENFGRIKDLLGGTQFLDIDVFVQDDFGEISGRAAQSDLQNLDRLVSEGHKYKYDYTLKAAETEIFTQLQWIQNKFESFLAINLEAVNYLRIGNFQNGVFPESSLGKSGRISFLNHGIKAGSVFKLSGRQNFEINAGYMTKAPGYRNAFVNPRQNNILQPSLTSERIVTGDLSYRYRSSFFNFRISGYYTEIRDITEISYYFTDGLSGLERESTAAFVQEVLSGMDKQYYGLELGAESQVTSTIKIKSALALGEYIYSNNPYLSLYSASFSENLDYGKAYLKNYHLSGGPQIASQIGFEYRDPDFWWFGVSLNYFARGFVDINPLTRTLNFQQDYDGLPLLDYDKEIASRLLKQEKFQDYFLTNLVGGKSWRIGDKYLGTFLSINNVLDVFYKSGGYEQARNSNYRTLKEDFDRELPLFTNKYWYGQGTTFFANVYLRF